MKRTAIIIAVLGISAWGFTQKVFGQSNAKPAGQNAPAGQAAGQAARLRGNVHRRPRRKMSSPRIRRRWR